MTAPTPSGPGPSRRPRALTPAGAPDALIERSLDRHPGKAWLAAVILAAAVASAFVYATTVLFLRGVGIWGINIPVAWGYAIANYVWWIGIGMAGTFVSSALLVSRQEWRVSISRVAETMTVLAVTIAGIFPILHLGRPYFFYWLLPYPNAMNMSPQWLSALEWDFWAIAAYLSFSILFWYLGLLPDLAALRDRAERRGAQIAYGLLALGWRGDARHWARHEQLSMLFAGIAIVLVFSVHSMVALDFSEGNTPGWHSTIFPPFFVAGAVYSGLALVLLMSAPLRRIFGLEQILTRGHLDALAKLVLASGLIVAYSYAAEIFTAYYSADPFELDHLRHAFFGEYAPAYWATIALNVVIPQALWMRSVRERPVLLAGIGAGIVVGMWLERFTIVVISLSQDFMPSAWGYFLPTRWDWLHLAGSIGVFALLLLLLLKFLPVVSIFELRRWQASTGEEKRP